MVFLLSFILPAVFYIRISGWQTVERETDYIEGAGVSYVGFSWGLVVVAVGGAFACTVQSVLLF